MDATQILEARDISGEVVGSMRFPRVCYFMLLYTRCCDHCHTPKIMSKICSTPMTDMLLSHLCVKDGGDVSRKLTT